MCDVNLASRTRKCKNELREERNCSDETRAFASTSLFMAYIQHQQSEQRFEVVHIRTVACGCIPRVRVGVTQMNYVIPSIDLSCARDGNKRQCRPSLQSDMPSSTATGLAITNPLVKYRALIATKAIAPDPVGIEISKVQGNAEERDTLGPASTCNSLIQTVRSLKRL